VPAEGEETGSEVASPASDPVDPAPAPTRVLRAAADEFGDLELDLLGRSMTEQELAEMDAEFDRLSLAVGLLHRWHADSRLDSA
jgi:hypothetical protein